MIKSTLITLSTVAVLALSGCSSSGKACPHHEGTQTKESVTFKGTPMLLTGHLVSVGDEAPQAIVVTKDLVEKTIGGISDKTQIVVVVPSVDTPVCNLETRTFNEKVAKLDNVDLTVVSMDLPFAAGRFCAAHGIDKVTVASDYRYNAVGYKYGVVIKEGLLAGILARAIFVIKDGKVIYKELVSEVTKEPNYDAVLEAI